MGLWAGVWEQCVQHSKPGCSVSTRVSQWHNPYLCFTVFSRSATIAAKVVLGLWSRWWFCARSRCPEAAVAQALSWAQAEIGTVSVLKSYNIIYNTPDTDTEKSCYLCCKGCTTIKALRVRYEMQGASQHFTNQRSNWFLLQITIVFVCKKHLICLTYLCY